MTYNKESHPDEEDFPTLNQPKPEKKRPTLTPTRFVAILNHGGLYLKAIILDSEEERETFIDNCTDPFILVEECAMKKDYV